MARISINTLNNNTKTVLHVQYKAELLRKSKLTKEGLNIICGNTLRSKLNHLHVKIIFTLTQL